MSQAAYISYTNEKLAPSSSPVAMQNFADIPIDYSWSFSDKTQKDTNYITHGYYTYPAKFIPKLASRLICRYSEKGDVVVDPFMGSGTTVVESLVNGRVGVGVDINEVAFLVAKAKTTLLDTSTITKEFNRIYSAIPSNKNYENVLFANVKTKGIKDLPKIIPSNERIDYWFGENQKMSLEFCFT